jgi:D-glycero-alpha-D-manno-heptose-7-phosphate kinase
LLHDVWQVKKTLEKMINNNCIDRYYEGALYAGALGGKLLGAGSGGFLLFFCERITKRVCRALGGVTEIPFGSDPQGMKVIYVREDYW